MKWKVLAGLRFFLALVVVCYHLKDYVPDYGKDLWCNLGKLNGLAAVLGFLLISGYSIANSISRNTEGFYQRRILRIYPLYFCAVFASLIPFLIIGEKVKLLRGEILQPDLWTVAGGLVFLQTFLVGLIASNPPLWTLSIEVLCYALAPTFMKLRSQVLVIIISLSAAFYVVFPYLYQILNKSKVPFYAGFKYGLPFCLFLWAWLLGFLYFKREKDNPSKVMLVGLGCLVLVLNQNHVGVLGILTYAMSSLVLIFAPHIRGPKVLLNIFNYLGDISYPLYLFHSPTLIVASAALGIKNSTTLVFVTLLVAMAFYHAVDVPIRSRKTPLSA